MRGRCPRHPLLVSDNAALWTEVVAGAAGWLLNGCVGLSGIMVTGTLFLTEGRFLKNYSPPFLLSLLEGVELESV